MKRRSILTGTTAFLSSTIGSPLLAGCLDRSTTNNTNPGGNQSNSDNTEQASGQEPPECDGTLEPLPQLFDSISYGRLGAFELIAEPDTLALGEEISLTLRWISENDDRTPVTGNREKFTIERKTSDGWQSIYRIPEHGGWNAMAAAPPESPPPTTWFNWNFTLTKQGMEQSSQTNTPYAVCEPLQAGTYRFVYWGVSPPQEEESDWETDYAIGVKFTVIE